MQAPASLKRGEGEETGIVSVPVRLPRRPLWWSEHVWFTLNLEHVAQYLQAVGMP